MLWMNFVVSGLKLSILIFAPLLLAIMGIVIYFAAPEVGDTLLDKIKDKSNSPQVKTESEENTQPE